MTLADLDFTERAPGRWETITRTGTEFTITWAAGLWVAWLVDADWPARQLGTNRATFDTFRRAVQWCADQCGPDDEEPF